MMAQGGIGRLPCHSFISRFADRADRRRRSVVRRRAGCAAVRLYSRLAPQYAPTEQNEPDEDAQLDPRLQRQIVDYATNEAPGTVIIDTPHTLLYFVLGNGKAIRYGIGVGREGFTWSGVKQVARKAEWPDWIRRRK